MNIKIYGTGTSGHQLVLQKVNEALEKAGLEYNLSDIRDVSKFIIDGVHSVPAIKVNDSEIFEIKPNGSFNSSLRSAIQYILKVKNYGELTKIIVPTDFSQVSFNAYNYANNLAKHINGMLLITHVYFPTSVQMNELSYMDVDFEKKSLGQLEEFVDSVNQDWIGEFLKEPFVESKFIVGFPQKELVELSSQANSMMVMGSTGASDNFKKIFGSLSLDMLKNSKCPVIVVPRDYKIEVPKKILFCSESLNNDANAIISAGKLCNQLGAKLEVVHVLSNNHDNYSVEKLDDLLRQYFENLDFNIIMLENSDVIGGIEKLISEKSYDLLMFNTKHRNYFTDFLHKSVTEHVALYHNYPLMVYHL